jgi:hypothetical protein
MTAKAPDELLGCPECFGDLRDVLSEALGFLWWCDACKWSYPQENHGGNVLAQGDNPVQEVA